MKAIFNYILVIYFSTYFNIFNFIIAFIVFLMYMYLGFMIPCFFLLLILVVKLLVFFKILDNDTALLLLHGRRI